MIDKTVLILGYGRAGKRHAALAKDLGMAVYIYDPLYPVPPSHLDGYTNCSYLDSEAACRNSGAFDCIVIATPPALHLQQIRGCLDNGAKAILCEKPLCAIGQLDEAKALPPDAPVMVAYNYRYHPKLVEVKGQLDSFNMYCEQYRADLPEWGLLLDHCSHDLDIARMITDHDLKIIRAGETIVGTSGDLSGGKISRTWRIETPLGGVIETVTTETVDRDATIYYNHGGKEEKIDIDPDPTMFTVMWKSFLAGDYYPDLVEAIKTQELLQQCYELNEERF